MTRDTDTIAELNERLRQLEELLAPSDGAFPIQWRLTQTEMLMLSCLVAGPEGYRSKEQLLHILIENSPQGDIGQGPNNLQTHISNLRKKLKPWKIVIETRWGLGFQLSVSSFKALRELHKTTKEAISKLNMTQHMVK